MASDKLWITEVEFEGDGGITQTLTVSHFGDEPESRRAAEDKAQKRLKFGEPRVATQQEYQAYYAEERLREALEGLRQVAMTAIDYAVHEQHRNRTGYAKWLVSFFCDNERAPTQPERDAKLKELGKW